MPKDAKKQEFVNPLQMLTQLSPYANTETSERASASHPTEVPTETPVEANREASPQIGRETPMDAQTSPKTITDTNMSIHPSVDVSPSAIMEAPVQAEIAMPTQVAASTSDQVDLKVVSDVGRYVFLEAFTPVSSQVSPSVEDMWSHLPSDVVSKHATESNAMFERTHEKISSWMDKLLKREMYARFRIGKRGGRKVTHILNEAIRDVLRKHQYLAALSQELRRPIDDLLLEAMQDLVKKYMKK